MDEVTRTREASERPRTSLRHRLLHTRVVSCALCLTKIGRVRLSQRDGDARDLVKPIVPSRTTSAALKKMTRGFTVSPGLPITRIGDHCRALVVCARVQRVRPWKSRGMRPIRRSIAPTLTGFGDRSVIRSRVTTCGSRPD
jgi:hypothetical protein